jgi:hypothetical protein
MQPEFRGPEIQEGVEAWIEISRQAQDPDAALEYAQRAANLRPDDPRVHESVQRSVIGTLDHDPFVAFLAETEKTYIVTLRSPRPIVVPKGRMQPEVFPTAQPTRGERALGMVWWMALGLLPAGIGALILSPFVVRRGVDVLKGQVSDNREKRLAILTIFLAFGIGALGGLFTSLLLLHMIA